MVVLSFFFKQVPKLALLLIGLALTYKIFSMLSPHNIIFIADNNIDSSIQLSIKKSLQELPTRSLGAKGILQALEKEYPFVKHVTITYNPSQTACIRIQAYTPALMLQADGSRDLLTDSGHVLSKHFYNEALLQHIPSISVKTNVFTKKDCAALLALEPGLFEKYGLVWHNKDKVEIRSLDHTDFVIVADATSIHQKEKIACAEAIYQKELKENKKGTQVDIRFKGSLISGPLRG